MTTLPVGQGLAKLSGCNCSIHHALGLLKPSIIDQSPLAFRLFHGTELIAQIIFKVYTKKPIVGELSFHPAEKNAADCQHYRGEQGHDCQIDIKRSITDSQKSAAHAIDRVA